MAGDKARIMMLPTDTHQDGDGKSDTRMVPHDWNIIHVNDDHDALYWSSRFDCTRDQLRDAVKAAGNSVRAVEKLLLKGTADPPRESFGNFPKP
jgi:hypothetical protein